MLLYHSDEINKATLPPMKHKNHLLHPLALALGFSMTLVMSLKSLLGARIPQSLAALRLADTDLVITISQKQESGIKLPCHRIA